MVINKFEKKGSHKINREIRLGGFYALERIAQDSKKDHPQIIESLAAYVRENASINKGPKENKSGLNNNKEDIQEILTIIGRRISAHDRPDQVINLSKTDLSNFNLSGINLAKANLMGVNLAEANLVGAHLEGVSLREGHLEDAALWGVHLEGADLEEAHLERAFLTGCHMEGACLKGAHLEGVCLKGAHLEAADLQGAYLKGSDLQGAYLEGVNLMHVNLENANLRDIKLENTNLKGANLKMVQKWEYIESFHRANITDVKNAPNGFIEFAKSKGAIVEKLND